MLHAAIAVNCLHSRCASNRILTAQAVHSCHKLVDNDGCRLALLRTVLCAHTINVAIRVMY